MTIVIYDCHIFMVQAPSFTSKYQTKLKKIACVERSNLFRWSVTGEGDGFKTAIPTVKGVTFKYTLRVQFYCPYLRCILGAYKFTPVPENAQECNFNCKGHLHVRFQRPISH